MHFYRRPKGHQHWKQFSIIPSLVFDVGMADARDTELYLKKGFHVVAIDANPELCEQARIRFSDYIDLGRLNILNFGIREGHSLDKAGDRSASSLMSFSPGHQNNEAAENTTNVLHRPLDYFLDVFGTPYYLKLDIKGLARSCLNALNGRLQLPKFVSAEITAGDFPAQLKDLGYTKFKLINQRLHMTPSMSKSHVDGREADHATPERHARAFGDETYGEWLSYIQILDEYHRICYKQFEGSYHQKIGCREFSFLSGRWELHARLS